jgi:hypothetical protein
MLRALRPTPSGDDELHQRATVRVPAAASDSGVRSRLVTRRDLPSANAGRERAGRRPTRELPPLDAVPRRLVEWDDLRGRNLSREQAYILALIDGFSTLEAVVDASAISPRAAYEALADLVREEIVGLE